jgi:hypothetical protein
MKTLTLPALTVLCSVAFLFISCQKELSVEATPPSTGGNGSTAAVYTLGGAGSVCTGVVLAGTYMNGIAMASTNTAKIQVNVTVAGTYSIATAAVNGVSFAASGSFTATGSQTIVLTASGTPTAAGAKTFSVALGTASCSFDISFAAAAPPAVFSLAGAPGACTLPLINGVYTAATPLSATNTVTIKVNVSTAGSYSIVTNTVNGISFSASGVFTATGTNVPVTLSGAGTPVAAGTTTLKPNLASTCSFDIPVAAAPVSTGIYSCKIDGVATTFTVNAAAGIKEALTNNPDLSLEGYKDSSHESYFQIFISQNDLSAVKAGTYDEKHAIPTSATNLGYRIEVDYSVKNADLSTTIWNTSSNFPPISSNNPAFTIVVTSITATRAKGTFSGKLTNTPTNNAFKTITEGVFDLPIQ